AGPLGRRRIYELDGVSGRARAGRSPRPDGRARSQRCRSRHLLGSAIGAAFAASMPAAALETWGWRIPFLFGLVVGVAGYLLRRHVLDNLPVKPRKRVPIVETLQDHW